MHAGETAASQLGWAGYVLGWAIVATLITVAIVKFVNNRDLLEPATLLGCAAVFALFLLDMLFPRYLIAV